MLNFEEENFDIIEGKVFEDNTTNYSSFNAEILAFLSLLVYEKESDILKILKNKDIIKDFKYEYFRFFEKDDTQAFVLADKQKMVFSFRGTEPKNIDDWQTNFSVKLIESHFGKVHKGFESAFLEIWEDIQSTIKEFRGESDKQSIWLTGHSLGGALATLAGMYLHIKDIKVNGLYSFGSPKIGNQNFVDKFDKIFKDKYFRFVNNNDGVVLVPFSSYEHAGTFLYFDTKGNLHTDLDPWQRWIDSLRGNIQAFRKFSLDYISDHSMNNYLRLLQKNRQHNPFL